MSIRRLGVTLTLLLLLAAGSALADGFIYTDPANLHIGTGAGTLGATGLGSDPNTIGSGLSFDIYYNNHGNGNLPIAGTGQNFYLVFAIPVYNGSSSTNSVTGTATMYSPYPGRTTTPVTIDTQHFWGTMTSGDIYAFMGYPDSNNNSFSYVNMVGCLMGTSCPNSSLLGSGAPLAGRTITGFDVYSYLIHTNSFGPGDLLDFQGSSLPTGSFIGALGLVEITKQNGTELKGWTVPFTQSGLTTPPPPQTPEPASLLLLGVGLAGLVGFLRRR